MPIRDSSHGNAETRRRSGRKDSRTERKERRERRAKGRMISGSNAERHGIQLQAAVHRALDRLRIDHLVIPNDHPYARSERVELIVTTGDTDINRVEFQFTLRHQTRPKIFQFLQAAIRHATQTAPRVYLEIALRAEMYVDSLADHVARTIKDIVRNVRAYSREAGNAIGLTLNFDAQNRRLPPEPLSLLGMIGKKARAGIETLLAGIEAARLAAEAAAKVARREAMERLRENMLTVAKKGRFYEAFLVVTRPFRGFDPHPAPAFASSQTRHPMRMPFRRR